MRIKISHVLAMSLLAFSGSGSLALAAWAPPTVAPTGGNIAAPLNSSIDPQEKDGGLSLWDYLVVANGTTAYGGITLPRPLGLSVIKGAGPSVVFQSPSTETATVPGTPDFCDVVGECSSTKDDDPGQSLTASYVCPPASGGSAYLYDIYEDPDTSDRYHRTVNCVADVSAYSIRTNDGTLEFLKNDAATPKFTLGQDGSVAMGPSAASFVINPSGNTSIGGTLDATGLLNANGGLTATTGTFTGVLSANGGVETKGALTADLTGVTTATDAIFIKAGASAGNGSIVINKPWLTFWDNSGTGARASIYAKNGDFDGTLGVTSATTLSSTLGVTGVSTLTGGASFPGLGIWNTSGNVGIGEVAPINKLSVQGNIGILRVPGTTIPAGPGPEISFQSPSSDVSGTGPGWSLCGGSYPACPSDGWNGDTANGYLCLSSDSGQTKTDVATLPNTTQKGYQELTCAAGTSAYSLRTNDGTLEFLNNDGQAKVFMNQNGNVGIGTGTTAPGAKLEVVGSTKLAGTVTLTDAGYFLGAPSYGFRFNDNASAYNNFIIYENGNTYTRGDATALSFSNSSDLNLKKNIVPLSGQLEKISQLQGVSFDWKKDDKHNLGLIAQEVEKVYPDLVSTDKITGLKSVQYGNLVAPLIEAVKELKTENNLLKVRLEKLENK